MPFPTRRRVVTTALATVAAGAAVPLQPAAAAQPAAVARHHPRPLGQAHAHNDYLHTHPLHDALSHGFTSIEADIFLVDGELLVAHEASDLDPARTLASLYLDPLLARVRANHGAVYPGHRDPVQLLIDIKTDGAAAYLELDRQLQRYRRMLTSYHDGRVRAGAVTPVISGDRAARVPMEAQRTRLAFYDGRLDDLGTAATASFIPLISSNWTQSFSWLGAGPFPSPNGTGSAPSSPPPIARAGVCASGPRTTWRAPNGTPSGTSCWPPGSTTSTPTIWRGWNSSSARRTAVPGAASDGPYGRRR